MYVCLWLPHGVTLCGVRGQLAGVLSFFHVASEGSVPLLAWAATLALKWFLKVTRALTLLLFGSSSEEETLLCSFLGLLLFGPSLSPNSNPMKTVLYCQAVGTSLTICHLVTPHQFFTCKKLFLCVHKCPLRKHPSSGTSIGSLMRSSRQESGQDCKHM